MSSLLKFLLCMVSLLRGKREILTSKKGGGYSTQFHIWPNKKVFTLGVILILAIRHCLQHGIWSLCPRLLSGEPPLTAEGAWSREWWKYYMAIGTGLKGLEGWISLRASWAPRIPTHLPLFP